jgi:hypothetical protein
VKIGEDQAKVVKSPNAAGLEREWAEMVEERESAVRPMSNGGDGYNKSI